MKKSRFDASVIVISLTIIVACIISYLYFDLTHKALCIISGITLFIVVLSLYIHNYKDNAYGGSFKKHYGK